MAVNQPTPGEQAEQVAANQVATEAQVAAAGEAAREAAEAQGAPPDEVKTAVEKARKEEKDKLYPQIQALKDAMTEIQEALRVEREEKEAVKKAATDEAERQRLASLSESQQVVEAMKKIEEQLAQEREERRKLTDDLAKRDHRQQLEAYKSRVLETNKDEILPELVGLVHGNTITEIDTAISNAKARSAEIAARFRQERGDGVRRALGGPANPDNAALEEQELNELQSSIDLERYATDEAYRKDMKGKVADAYNRANGRS